MRGETSLGSSHVAVSSALVVNGQAGQVWKQALSNLLLFLLRERLIWYIVISNPRSRRKLQKSLIGMVTFVSGADEYFSWERGRVYSGISSR
jgi:hypothetical protein